MNIMGSDKTKLIDELLSSGGDLAGCAARLIATDAPAIMERWMNSEFARGTHPFLISMAFVQTAASLSASMHGVLFSEKEDEAFKQYLAEGLEKVLVTVIAHARGLSNGG